MSVSSVLRHEMSAPPARPRFADVAAENLDGVHRYLCHLTGDRDLADDLTSATFERALRDWGRYDPARGSSVGLAGGGGPAGGARPLPQGRPPARP